MGLNWVANDYFSMLIQRDKRCHAALEMLVDDLHSDKERTINRFLTHSGSEDFLWGLVKLLGNDNSRVAGNSAYILGTLAESDFGSMRVLSLTSSRNPESKQILPDLTRMLTFDDAESVMNAAGTMGTLAESHDGRQWMLTEPCLAMTIQHITDLLRSDNLWTASNAALVLARLTISEEGCEKLLNHCNWNSILSRLIASLGVDEAGRGMNAAFAIGRMCDLELGRTRLLGLQESEKMITSLAKMLCCPDPGASKNACFALSCLATNKEGLHRLLRNSQSHEVLKMLSELLSSSDNETGWFAAMTLRTLASQQKGCLRLRDNSCVLPALKAAEARMNVNSDLHDEVVQAIEILKRLDKPPPPSLEVSGSQVRLSWPEVKTKSGFCVKYHIFEGSNPVWNGKETECVLNDLKPFTQYLYRLRAYTEGDDSPLSDPAALTTEEGVPGPPAQVRILACTTSQLKVGWDPPEVTNGSLKGYYVYNGKQMVEHTTELSAIISGLQASTTYEIMVCAATSRGKGAKESVMGTTAEMGAHAPSKPEVTVRGRSELNISWRPPEVPLGRISRYDVLLNGEVTYSGTALHCVVRRLKPDTEYVIIVCAITSEGKCESKSTKKRTARDEFEGERAPLYQTPVKPDPEKKSETPKSSPKKRKSVSGPSGAGQTLTSHQEAAKPRVSSASVLKNRIRMMIMKPGPKTEKSLTNEPEHMSPRKGSLGFPDNMQESSNKGITDMQKLHASINSKPRKTKQQASTEVTGQDQRDLPKPDKPKPATRPKSASRRPSKSNTNPDHDVASGNASKKLSWRPSGDKRDMKSAEVAEKTRTSINARRGSHPASPHGSAHSTVRRGGSGGAGSLSASLPDNLQVAEGHFEELPRVRHTRNDTDISWLSQTKRSEFPMTQDTVTRVYSTLPSQLKQNVTQPLKPGVMEFDSPVTMGKLTPGQANYLQRASTFVASHRPAAKRQLEKIHTRTPTFGHVSPSAHQWQPELPANRLDRNHNKFVPMQFRTQPANLPGAVSRQNTIINDKSFSPIEVVSRSLTEITFRTPPVIPSVKSSSVASSAGSHHKHSERNVLSHAGSTKSSSGGSQNSDVTTSLSDRVSKTSVLSSSSHGGATAESLLVGLGMSNHNADSSALQSAR